jgi:hypothetical protein
MEINMNQEWLDKAMELADEYARTGPHRVNMIVSRNALLSHLKTAQAAPKPLLYTRAEAAWIAEQVTDAATPVQAAPIEPEPIAKELRDALADKHAAVRKVLQHHGLTKHGDAVVEADLIAALDKYGTAMKGGTSEQAE